MSKLEQLEKSIYEHIERFGKGPQKIIMTPEVEQQFLKEITKIFWPNKMLLTLNGGYLYGVKVEIRSDFYCLQ